MKLEVGFRETNGTPPEVAAALPRFALYRYAYRPVGADEDEARLGAGPYAPELGPGSMSIDLFPPSITGRARAGSPPVAIVPVPGTLPTGLVFDDLLLIEEHEVALRADDLASLIGRSIPTPLGEATVRDVQTDGSDVAITIAYGGEPSSQEAAGYAVAGYVTAWFRIGKYSTPPAVSGADSAGIQSFQLHLPRDEQGGALSLVLDQFELLHKGPVRLTGIEAACR
jgi:hypothetical protein